MLGLLVWMMQTKLPDGGSTWNRMGVWMRCVSNVASLRLCGCYCDPCRCRPHEDRFRHEGTTFGWNPTLRADWLVFEGEGFEGCSKGVFGDRRFKLVA